MPTEMVSQIAELEEMPLEELTRKHEEMFPGVPTPKKRTTLWRKIAYRLQELEYGGLPEDARDRLQALIQTEDPLRRIPARSGGAENPDQGAARLRTRSGRDARLPIPGSVIAKDYKGTRVEVKVLDKGFEYQAKTYRSLSAIAKEVSGNHWNGYLFFGLLGRSA